jgi:SPP1 family predicted phage head-tail adaptor
MKYNKNEVTGKMRDRIILQNVNRSRSLTGFASESWADTATIWAFAESKLPGSNETIIDGKNTAKNVCDFTIRYISTITEESRVVWGDKLYQVKNLKVSHDRRFISFQGVFYDSYILRGVNVDASVNGIGTTSANLKLIMSVIGQANASASTTATITKIIEVSSLVNANASLSGDINFVQKAQASLLATGTTTADLTVNAPSDSLLLDLYPNAATAYSLRKLRTAYTGSAVRVRASTSGAEGDVSFDVNSTISASSTVTITAVGTSGLSIGQQVTFSTFWNAGGSNQNVFVTTWYDQSGNARDAAQTTQANQPQIVSSGVIILSGSRPSISFDDINDFMVNNMISITSNFSLIAVINSDSKDFSVYYGSNKDIEFGTTIGYVLDAYRIQSESSILIIQPVSLLYSLFFNYRNDTSGFLYQNNSLKGQGNVSGNFELQVIGGRQTQNNLYYDGKIQELITYTNNQSSNRVAIETNINTHYEIY